VRSESDRQDRLLRHGDRKGLLMELRLPRQDGVTWRQDSGQIARLTMGTDRSIVGARSWWRGARQTERLVQS
jgi:hypothetical protein